MINFRMGKIRRRLVGKYCAVIVFLFSYGPVQSSEIAEDIPVSTVAHYGAGVGISAIYVNGGWVGNQGGWGGGGGSVCCVKISTDRIRPVFIDVKWRTCDIRNIVYENGLRVDPDARCKETWHLEKIPVNFSEGASRNNRGLVIHILPGHKVEAWISDKDLRNPNYPGPKYPSGPAPDYVSAPEDVDDVKGDSL